MSGTAATTAVKGPANQASSLASSNIVRHSVVYGTATLVAYSLSMVKTIVVTRMFGTTPEMDAYTIAILAPNLLGALVTSTAAAGLVPALAKAELLGPERRATVFRTSFLVFVTICALGTVLLATFSNQVIKLMAFALDPNRANAARSMLPLASLLFVFTGIYAFAAAELLSRKKFIVVAAAPAVSTLLSLVMIWASGSRGIMVLVWALVLGTAAQAAVVAIPAWKASKEGTVVSCFDSGVREVLAAQVALLGVAMIGVVNVFIDQIVSTWLPAGNVSALNYAATLNNIVMQVVVMTLGWVALPDLSELAAAGDTECLRKRMRACLVIAVMIAAPVCILILCFGQTAIRVVFQHGQFQARSTHLVYLAWAGYSTGLVPAAIAMMAVRLANALQVNSVLLRIGAVLLVLNACLDFVLMRTVGLLGISLSTSIVYCVAGVLLYASLRPHVGIILDRPTWRLIIITACGNIGAIVPVLALGRLFPASTIFGGLGVLAFGLLVALAYRFSNLLLFETIHGPWPSLRFTVEDRL
jgi:putative peptidoglycan lipid II flippase